MYSGSVLFMQCSFLIILSSVWSASSLPSSTDSLRNTVSTEKYQRLNSFDRLRLSGRFFVDKSQLILEYLKSPGKVFIISRPSHWGKTVNSDMIKRFLELETDTAGVPYPENNTLSYRLFVPANGETYGNDDRSPLVPLRISKNAHLMRERGQFPVISLNFRNVTGSNYAEVEDKMRTLIRRLFGEYEYLKCHLEPYYSDTFDRYLAGDANYEQLMNSLKFLTERLNVHFNRTVHVLVDDYDVPISELCARLIDRFRRSDVAISTVLSRNVFRSEEFERTARLVRGILSACFVDNRSVARGLLSGTFHVFLRDSFGTEFRKVMEGGLLDKRFSNFYGFTLQDIEGLAENASFAVDYERLRRWYGGFDFGVSDRSVHNPYSVIRYFEECGKFDRYWNNENPISRQLLTFVDSVLAGKLLNLTDGQSVLDDNNIKMPFDITYRGPLGLLFYNGYLSSVDGVWNFTCVNLETTEILKNVLQRWTLTRANLSSDDFIELRQCLTTLQLDRFQMKILAIMRLFEPNEKALYYRSLIRSFLRSLEGTYTVKVVTENVFVMFCKPRQCNYAIVLSSRLEPNGTDPATLPKTAEAAVEKVVCDCIPLVRKKYFVTQDILAVSIVYVNGRLGIGYVVDQL